MEITNFFARIFYYLSKFFRKMRSSVSEFFDIHPGIWALINFIIIVATILSVIGFIIKNFWYIIISIMVFLAIFGVFMWMHKTGFPKWLIFTLLALSIINIIFTFF